MSPDLKNPLAFPVEEHSEKKVLRELDNIIQISRLMLRLHCSITGRILGQILPSQPCDGSSPFEADLDPSSA